MELLDPCLIKSEIEYGTGRRQGPLLPDNCGQSDSLPHPQKKWHPECLVLEEGEGEGEGKAEAEG